MSDKYTPEFLMSRNNNHTKAADFIQAHFQPGDRVAIMMRQHSNQQQQQQIEQSGFRYDVMHRFLDRDKAASEEIQRFLRAMNAHRADIYIAANPVNEGAMSRTKADIAQVRHLYLDIDKDGPQRMNEILGRAKAGELPLPSSVVTSSAGKYQVLWRVDGFGKDQAERTMRGMVQEFGADPAATDVSRVVRLPGYFNHKYDPPQYVTVHNRAPEHVIYRPQDFPQYEQERARGTEREHVSRAGDGRITQSHRDWAFAMKHLSQGMGRNEIETRIASYRQDKPNPEYYARTTMDAAEKEFKRRQDRGYER